MSNFIPRGWRQNSNKQLQDIYNECCNKAIELKMLDYTPKLYIFKSTTMWGWARYPDKYDKMAGHRPYVGLNEVYLQDPTKAYNTICHELAHIASPAKEHHGYTWKYNFAKLGRQFGLDRFERCSSSSYVGLKLPKKDTSTTEYKYRAYCPTCGNEWKYKSRCKIIQNPSRWSCNKCKTKLKSEKI